MGYSFQLAERDLLYAPSHRLDMALYSLCYPSCGALNGSTMRDRSNDPLQYWLFTVNTNLKTPKSVDAKWSDWVCSKSCWMIVIWQKLLRKIQVETKREGKKLKDMRICKNGMKWNRAVWLKKNIYIYIYILKSLSLNYFLQKKQCFTIDDCHFVLLILF